MNKFSPGLVLFFLFSAYGWGLLCRRFCDRRLFRFRMLTVAAGLALLNAVGGLLNLLGLAGSGMLLVLSLAGVARAAVELLRTRPWMRLRPGVAHLPLGLALLGTMAVAACLLPADVYNVADDFRVYCVRVARMCGTGSVGGNPLDMLGLDGLGSQSFFQGFFLAGPDIHFLQGFDAVSCFAICLLLPAELAARLRLPWLVGLLAVLFVFSVNPQQVNISPLYSGAAAVMGVVCCGVFLGRGLASSTPAGCSRSNLSLALMAAWLVTLKATLALFGAFFLLAMYALLLLIGKNPRRTLKSGVAVAGMVSLLVLPWAFVCLRPVLRARSIGNELQPAATIAAKYSSMAVNDLAGLFARAPLQYGDWTFSFLLLAGACLAAGICILLPRPAVNRPRHRASPAVLAAAAFCLPLILAANAYFFTADTGIRYSCPVLLGVGVMMALWSLRLARPRAGSPPSRTILAATCGCLFGTVILFGGTCWARVRLAAADRTILAFPVDANLVNYCRHVASPFQSEYVRSVQGRMEPGSTALVWIATAYQLDFSRNRLLTVSEPGLANPLLKFPAGVDPGALAGYLRRNGVRYVLLETNGYTAPQLDRLRVMADSRYAMFRKYAEFEIYLHHTLLLLAEQNPVRYADDSMVLFELAAEPAPQPTRPAAAAP